MRLPCRLSCSPNNTNPCSIAPIQSDSILIMSRYFNTTGPCFPRLHYMLPPSQRLVGASLSRYIRDELYWVLHAPRQTGKTTFLQSWMTEINAGTEAVACYISLERCQAVPEIEKAMPAIAEAIRESAIRFGVPVPDMPTVSPQSMLAELMTDWARLVAPQKLVVLFDEVDVVEGPAMISLLRQLRSGFAGRGVGQFPASIALVGMRDLRDYLVGSKHEIPVNPGSPFNIKHDSATLSHFSRADIETLTLQHTTDTGQVFSSGALDRIAAYTSGQPWLVNALCDQIVYRILASDYSETIQPEHVDVAKERLIASRTTHIDALGQRLQDPRVRRVIEPIITGASDPEMAQGDDFQLCLDLGLATLDDRGVVGIANAIYREVLVRELSFGMQTVIPEPEYNWQKEDGSLDMDALLHEFQRFWQRHSDAWEEKADYTEAFPHLLLMAFLQRVVNGGGRIDREYAAGRGRVDLVIHFADQLHVVEIKLVHPADGRDSTRDEGIRQISRYADKLQADTCHLVIFDRRPHTRSHPWAERLQCESAQSPLGNRTIEIVWC